MTLTNEEKQLAKERFRGRWLEQFAKYGCPFTFEFSWKRNRAYVYRNALGMKKRLSASGFALYLSNHEQDGWKIYSRETGKHIPA